MFADRYEVFAGLAIVLAIARYATYFYSIYKKETKPHAFSWLLWGVMVGIGAWAQFELQGGPSFWALLFVSVSCLCVAVLAFFIGEKNYTASDWLALGGALCAIPVWRMTDNPLSALAILMFIDCLSYYPTLRKSYAQPDTEPPVSYFISGMRYFLILFSVPEPTWQTLVYPLFLMLTDWVAAAYIVFRRWQLDLPLHEYAKE